MTYIKDLIEIPDHIGRGDFVLRLSEGITDPEGTVKHYQVTPQLVDCFDQALNLVKGSLQGAGGRSTSKAAYLHGSFGSGKSHFMAILHLILAGNSHARAIPELAEVIAKHSSWMEGKKFLMVPYHLLGAKNLESAILGGYADFIGRTHPTAPTPSVFLAEGLLANAEQLRGAMGDAKFFELLNKGKSGGGGWGSLSAAWDAVSYVDALNSAHNSESCRRLVRDLVDTHFPAMKNTEDYVDLDDGLAVISAHAKEIGYDTVVLFLDELILWLASYAGDQNFISREGNKVVKLVESTRADRPVPLVSFIARQRDLRDLIGKQVAGAEKLAFSHVLDHHEGRFGVINLEDRNLPAIASKRILLPKSDAAKAQMDAEFDRTKTLREEVMKTLLTRDANREDFRNLYPFSPALVETLVAVSSLLQRERTALKVMAMLLSQQKNTLQLGQMVPVGDLFDQVSQGDEAFSSDMKVHFDNANRLYQQHLKPLLERQHQISFEQANLLEWDEPKRAALRNDDRLIKTLLLAALVPEVEALKNMTPQKLAALNHGTIKSPIPGQEAATVINKFKSWVAAGAGQIKVREGAGQTTLAIQLSSVDTEQILAKAEGVDNRGNRIAKLKELTFKELGQEDTEQLFYTHEFKWRGTPRRVDILFANIRDLPTTSLTSKGDHWKVVIDYPFDERDHTIRDDVAKIEGFLSEEEAARTICWLPCFFNHETLEALGTFVRLEQILKESQFPNYVQHLNEVDRETARNQLQSHRDQLCSQMVARLEMAYAIRSGGEDYLDQGNSLEPSEQFRCLDSGVTLQPPAAANLQQGLQGLLDQALRQQFPAHPHFDERISLTKGAVSTVLENVIKAVQSSEPSILVETSLRRPMVLLANPLKLGEMTEQRFQVGQHWRIHFNQHAAQAPGHLTVGNLRKWINLPEPMGLPEILEDLVILCYAEQTNRVFKRHGGPAHADLGTLEDDMTLEEVSLPSEADWQVAAERAKAIFGVPVSPLLNATNVAQVSDALRQKAKDWAVPAGSLIGQLEELQDKRFPGTEWTRLKTGREAHALLKTLEGASGNDLIGKLAGFVLDAKPAALGVALANAAKLDQLLEVTDWEIFDGIKGLADERKDAANRIWGDLADALGGDEYAVALVPKLAELRQGAVKLLTKVMVPPPTPPPAPTPVEIPFPIVPEPPTKTVTKLKELYRDSQVKGDELPEWLQGDAKLSLLRVRRFGSDPDDWKSSIVVGPLYDALIQADGGARIDLAKKMLILPRFGKELPLHVNPEHLES